VRIVTNAAAASPEPGTESMHALKMQLDRLKEEVVALRAGAIKAVVQKQEQSAPQIVIAPVPQEQPAAPAMVRAPQDPLFAQLWAYVKHEK
jgi:hypothetical protein